VTSACSHLCSLCVNPVLKIIDPLLRTPSRLCFISFRPRVFLFLSWFWFSCSSPKPQVQSRKRINLRMPSRLRVLGRTLARLQRREENSPAEPSRGQSMQKAGALLPVGNSRVGNPLVNQRRMCRATKMHQTLVLSRIHRRRMARKAEGGIIAKTVIRQTVEMTIPQ